MLPMYFSVGCHFDIVGVASVVNLSLNGQVRRMFFGVAWLALAHAHMLSNSKVNACVIHRGTQTDGHRDIYTDTCIWQSAVSAADVF